MLKAEELPGRARAPRGLQAVRRNSFAGLATLRRVCQFISVICAYRRMARMSRVKNSDCWNTPIVTASHRWNWSRRLSGGRSIGGAARLRLRLPLPRPCRKLHGASPTDCVSRAGQSPEILTRSVLACGCAPPAASGFSLDTQSSPTATPRARWRG